MDFWVLAAGYACMYRFLHILAGYFCLEAAFGNRWCGKMVLGLGVFSMKNATDSHLVLVLMFGGL